MPERPAVAEGPELASEELAALPPTAAPPKQAATAFYSDSREAKAFTLIHNLPMGAAAGERLSLAVRQTASQPWQSAGRNNTLDDDS